MIIKCSVTSKIQILKGIFNLPYIFVFTALQEIIHFTTYLHKLFFPHFKTLFCIVVFQIPKRSSKSLLYAQSEVYVMQKCLFKSSEYSPIEKKFSDTTGRNSSLWIDAIVWKHTINTVYYSKYHHLYETDYNSFEELVHNEYKVDTLNSWMTNLSEWTSMQCASCQLCR